MPKAKFQIERKCNVCGQTFLAKNLDSVHCSKKCSNVAYRMRRRQERENAQLLVKAQSIPDARTFISVSEAISLFAVSRSSLYRNIRNGTIPIINLGERLIRINRKYLESHFARRYTAATIEKHQAKVYNMEPENCYTIGEISEKFKVSPSTVYSTIRKNSIPTRQIGKYVYAPKPEIDRIFKH